MSPEPTGRSSSVSGDRFARLSPTDSMFLHLETGAWPCHFGGLAVLEGGLLLDDSGQLRLKEIREHLDRRVSRVPKLRQRLHDPGPLAGRPLWVADDRFAIEHHVGAAAVAAPGSDAEFLATACSLYDRLLDRSRPLWELWLITGRSDGKVGMLLKLHHSVADGLAVMGILGTLLDLEPDAPEPPPLPWRPEPAPGYWPLLADNLSAKGRALGRGLKTLAHPWRIARGARSFARMTRRFFGKGGASCTSLNRVVQAGRRLGVLRLNLAEMKQEAHVRAGKVNDVVLALWSGGLRSLLVSRGETVAGAEVLAGQAATLRTSPQAGTIDNRVGTLALRLPLSEADAGRRLETVIAVTRRAKAEQRPAAVMGYLAGLAATPIGRYFSARQRAANVIVTNVMGPPVPVYMLGAEIQEILPIIELVGNIGLTLCAFSYAGRVFMAVTADAGGFPDLEVLMQGMKREWDALIEGQGGERNRDRADPA